MINWFWVYAYICWVGVLIAGAKQGNKPTADPRYFIGAFAIGIIMPFLLVAHMLWKIIKWTMKLITGRCEFSSKCSNFRANSDECNNQSLLGSFLSIGRHCGAYWEHKK